MNVETLLRERSASACELCGAGEPLTVVGVPPDSDGSVEQSLLLCETCHTQFLVPAKADVNHWRCLNTSM